MEKDEWKDVLFDLKETGHPFLKSLKYVSLLTRDLTLNFVKSMLISRNNNMLTESICF